MKDNILQFRLRKNPTRGQAMQWLLSNRIRFPNYSETSPISENVFHGWRFISAADGIVYFANCVEPGISLEDISLVSMI